MANYLGTVFPTRTHAEWMALNPLVAKGQGVYESDTGALKIGNGTDVYANLPYFVGAIQALDPAAAQVVRFADENGGQLPAGSNVEVRMNPDTGEFVSVVYVPPAG
ncbi:tail protein [Gordonia phage NadineRae]|uniref:Minor tail protein n=1 Tax=Gordonia phage NadineRae TaxID=2652882 RepID=A0A5P8DFE4_9CAUD|nr:tail protein [Gordonia phage NadineRae]QFP97707.1 hypothetical protein SEA_NADINERAE_21 [Gordonia phage NadineRae]